MQCFICCIQINFMFWLGFQLTSIWLWIDCIGSGSIHMLCFRLLPSVSNVLELWAILQALANGYKDYRNNIRSETVFLAVGILNLLKFFLEQNMQSLLQMIHRNFWMIGLFMALQTRLIACGKSNTIFGMVLRFLTGPAVMAVASIAVGLLGRILHIAIVQVSSSVFHSIMPLFSSIMPLFSFFFLISMCWNLGQKNFVENFLWNALASKI